MRRPISLPPTGNADCAASSAVTRRSCWKIWRRPVLLGVSRRQPAVESQLPRGDTGLNARRKLLFLPGLRHERTGHLQAHRVRPRPAGEEARGEGRLCAGVAPAFSEIYLRNDGARACIPRRNGLPAGRDESGRRLFDASRGGVLPEERFGELEHFLATAAKSGHELRAYDDALDFIAGRRDAARRAEVLDSLFPRGAADKKLAKLLKVPLYPYQAEGALFAVRAGRALIGDEMGLGKTIQAIAATEILARHFGVSRVLVVCPTSLKYQWQGEIAAFPAGGGAGDRRRPGAAAEGFQRR